MKIENMIYDINKDSIFVNYVDNNEGNVIYILNSDVQPELTLLTSKIPDKKLIQYQTLEQSFTGYDRLIIVDSNDVCTELIYNNISQESKDLFTHLLIKITEIINEQN
jgi:hypothetical protein